METMGHSQSGAFAIDNQQRQQRRWIETKNIKKDAPGRMSFEAVDMLHGREDDLTALSLVGAAKGLRLSKG